MAYDPENPASFKKLKGAAENSYKQLSPFRTVRMRVLREYVGQNYSENGAPDKVPINMIKTATNVYARILSPKSPKAMVLTDHQRLKPIATLMELNLNHVIKEIDLHKTLKIWLLESLMSFGCVKIGLVDKGMDEIEGVLHDAGQPYCDPVYLDDWVQDMSALSFETMGFMGNRWRAPIDWAQENPLFNKKYRQKLKVASTSGGEMSDDEAAYEIGAEETSRSDEYKDYVELWDMYLPQERLLITYADGQDETDKGVPLRVVEWEGPERGPYRVLSHYKVPSNTMPLPPAADYLDLHDLVNRLMRKLARQAERQKTFTGVQGNANADGRRVVDVNDGETIKIDNPKNWSEFSAGGINQQNMAFMIFARDLLKEQAGNIDALGGLGAMSDTVGQDNMIKQAANAMVEEMQDTVVTEVGGILEDLAHYEWTDPNLSRTLHIVVPGLEDDIRLPVRFSQDTLEGDFQDYNFNIHPYSMKHESPSTKLQNIFTILERIVYPLMPMMEQQGVQVNVEGLMRNIAKLTNMDELDDLFIFTSPQMESGMGVVGSPGGSRGPGKAPFSTRRYERVSKSASSQASPSQQMMEKMMAGGDVAGNSNSIGRGVA
jgi:hypothetical protein